MTQARCRLSPRSVMAASSVASAAAPLLSLDPERQREFQAEVHRVRKAASKVRNRGDAVVSPAERWERNFQRLFTPFLILPPRIRR